MTIPLTIPLAQCPGPSGSLLPLILAGGAVWGLWQGAKWTGHWFANRRGVRKGAGLKTKYAVFVLPALLAVVIAALAAGHALRPAPQVALAATDRPRVVFLGAGRCRPCQAMEPVRETLRTEYADGLLVEYYDVWEDPEPGHRFGIKTIPTTIFVGPDGGELRRRQGYMSEDEIVNAWSELGFALKKGDAYVEPR